MKKSVLIPLLLFCLCSFSPAQAATLRILTLSDIQGAIKPDKDHLGGLARIATVIKDAKKEGAKEGLPVWALNVGNNVVYQRDRSTFERFRGKPEFGGVALCSMDVAALGNDDFVMGPESLAEAIGYGKVDTLCSNFSKDTSEALTKKLEDYKVMDFKGHKIGFFALLVQAFEGDVYTNKDYVETAKKMVETLRNDEKCTTVIAMTHMGYLWDRKLAESVASIDVICGSQSHISLKEPTVIKGTSIVHSGSYGRRVGDLRLHLDDTTGAMKSLDWSLIYIDKTIKPDQEVTRFLKPYRSSYPGEAEEECEECSLSGGCQLCGSFWALLLALPLGALLLKKF